MYVAFYSANSSAQSFTSDAHVVRHMSNHCFFDALSKAARLALVHSGASTSKSVASIMTIGLIFLFKQFAIVQSTQSPVATPEIRATDVWFLSRNLECRGLSMAEKFPSLTVNPYLFGLISDFNGSCMSALDESVVINIGTTPFSDCATEMDSSAALFVLVSNISVSIKSFSIWTGTKTDCPCLAALRNSWRASLIFIYITLFLFQVKFFVCSCYEKRA